MSPTMKSLGALLGLASAVNGLYVPEVAARDDANAASSQSAIYFLQNDPKGASIVAFDPSASNPQPVITSTGGKGLSGTKPGTNQPLTRDQLSSQGSVIVRDNVLMTVNAGSNTVSMFTIDPSNPLHLTMVGKPADSMGDFPVSVTYSPGLKTACVINGGKRNSVACFDVDMQKGLAPCDSPRNLGLSLTTPPAMNASTVSQVSFSQDDRFLMATVKGAGKVPGSTTIWPVQGGRVSENGVKTTINDMPAPFGFALGKSGSIFTSDPTYGGSVVRVGWDDKVHELKYNNETGVLKAACWAAYSPSTDRFYAIDAADTQFGKYSPYSGALEGFVKYDSSLGGAFDIVADARQPNNLWFLASVPSVAAVDVTTSKVTHNITFGSTVGNRMYWEGIAMYEGHKGGNCDCNGGY